MNHPNIRFFKVNAMWISVDDNFQTFLMEIFSPLDKILLNFGVRNEMLIKELSKFIFDNDFIANLIFFNELRILQKENSLV